MAKVLFVDDEHDLVNCAEVFFKEAGYDFVGAYDGREGLRKASEERPNLICLDVTMPRLSGWDVLQMLQDDESTAGIPVLMLTAMTQDRSKAQGWGLGCTWYHTKPFDFDELLIVIERILAGTEPPHA